MVKSTKGSAGAKLLECVNPRRGIWRVRWDVTEHADGTAEWREMDFDHRPTRDELVAALVRTRYDRDAMEAIVNNYLADPADAEHAAEMAAMQAWRAEAKAIATRALEETSTTR